MTTLGIALASWAGRLAYFPADMRRSGALSARGGRQRVRGVLVNFGGHAVALPGIVGSQGGWVIRT
jgi:hypothetical protein